MQTTTNWVQTVDWTVATNGSTLYPIQTATPVYTTAPSFTPGISKVERVRRFVRDIWERLKSERGGTAPIVLPRFAGGSQELDTEKKVEHKKKITLERKTGVPRDKGSGIEDIHRGTVELVRTMEGTDLQKSTVGIKVSPKDSTSHVEIPYDVLLDALHELGDQDERPA